MYKAWACTNPDCGFSLRVDKGEVTYGKKIEPNTEAAWSNLIVLRIQRLPWRSLTQTLCPITPTSRRHAPIEALDRPAEQFTALLQRLQTFLLRLGVGGVAFENLRRDPFMAFFVGQQRVAIDRRRGRIDRRRPAR